MTYLISYTFRFAVLSLFFLLTSCASVNLSPPQVSLLDIRPSTTGGLDMLFDIDLRISNPNAIAMPVKGMSYTIAFNGTKVLQGVSNQIPEIPAYGSEDVSLSVSTNLLSAPKLLVNLLKNPSREIKYELHGKIDLVNPLPAFNFVETGLLPTIQQ